jgi:hypothetical protein
MAGMAASEALTQQAPSLGFDGPSGCVEPVLSPPVGAGSALVQCHQCGAEYGPRVKLPNGSWICLRHLERIGFERRARRV